ncbi:Neuropeptide FF receptor 1 [Acropora cervicornis]|uniref:Neuropeptide FF receptor 1 n=1 Tax=Acropora cervicornis TaxID=6130 RepID=A0AAD9QML9_ACRCE|nr:Neuropeptide FF receptor 1 [Acropora cervicornis]
MEEITIELLVIETVIFIIGLVGNIFVLVITCKVKNKTIHGTFVASLAIADLVLLCFDSPTNILQKLGTRSNIFNCRIHLIATTAGYNAGLFSITSMALHRYFVVTHPWRPKLKRKNALIWISLIWTGALTLVIPLIVVIKPGENTCHEVWPLLSLRQAYTATLMSVQYVLPLVITAICYVKIWLFLRRRPFASQSRLRTGESTTPGETSKESVVILKTVAVIVVLFLVLLLPTQVAWVLLNFKNISFDKLWFAIRNPYTGSQLFESNCVWCFEQTVPSPVHQFPLWILLLQLFHKVLLKSDWSSFTTNSHSQFRDQYRSSKDYSVTRIN